VVGGSVSPGSRRFEGMGSQISHEFQNHLIQLLLLYHIPFLCLQFRYQVLTSSAISNRSCGSAISSRPHIAVKNFNTIVDHYRRTAVSAVRASHECYLSVIGPRRVFLLGKTLAKEGWVEILHGIEFWG